MSNEDSIKIIVIRIIFVIFNFTGESILGLISNEVINYDIRKIVFNDDILKEILKEIDTSLHRNEITNDTSTKLNETLKVLSEEFSSLTLLIIAIHLDKVGIVQSFLDLKVNPKSYSWKGGTLIDYAFQTKKSNELIMILFNYI